MNDVTWIYENNLEPFKSINFELQSWPNSHRFTFILVVFAPSHPHPHKPGWHQELKCVPGSDCYRICDVGCADTTLVRDCFMAIPQGTSTWLHFQHSCHPWFMNTQLLSRWNWRGYPEFLHWKNTASNFTDKWKTINKGIFKNLPRPPPLQKIIKVTFSVLLHWEPPPYFPHPR